MHLYLVQHAEAKSKQEDPERTLSDKGLADIGRVAAYVAEHASIQVHEIFHSGKARAQQTAEVLNEALSPGDGINISTNLSPLADVSIWAEHLTDMHLDIMLVGHLPHLSKLAAYLICRDEERIAINFHNAGVVCLSRDEAGEWSVQWIITPDIV